MTYFEQKLSATKVKLLLAVLTFGGQCNTYTPPVYQQFTYTPPVYQQYTYTHPVCKKNIRRKMKRWMEKQHQALWCGPCSTQRQAGELISGPDLATRA